MEGNELISELNKTDPQMIKIVITGFPSFDNAVTSLNLGANAYITKPVNSSELLELVAEKIEKQQTASKVNEAQVADWVSSKIRQITREKNAHQAKNDPH
jgi:YesN/AraC family two-component response regulator